MSQNRTVFIATRFGSVKEVTFVGFACRNHYVITHDGYFRSENCFTDQQEAKLHAATWASVGCKRIPKIKTYPLTVS